MHRSITVVLFALAGSLSIGCSGYQSNEDLMASVNTGNFGVARDVAIATASTDPGDKSYMLGRSKIMLASMADGVPLSTEGNADRLYDFLRTQNVNEGAGVKSVFVSESNATFWKGEPFEQAMSYAYIAAFDGTQGDWGNVRAAASNSIFLIRDFSESIESGYALDESEDAQNPSEMSDEQRALAEREAIIRDAQDNAPEDGSQEGLDFDLIESDFELGYALQAIASHQLGNRQDRDANLRALRGISPRFSEMSRRIESGGYNTVVLVSYGLGPEKYGAGFDEVIEMYRPRTPSGDEHLVVRSPEGSHRFPVMTDVNRLALDTRWTNLEGMRRAKSVIGTAMVGVGAGVAATADSTEQAIAGILLMIGGAIAKEQAEADTRHCEIMPQRTYVALLDLPEGVTSDVHLEIEGIPDSRLVLPHVTGPERGAPASFHYVRLTRGDHAWRTGGNVVYATDAYDLPAPTLPYIMGGRCLRTPSPDLMGEYRSAGLPSDVTYDDLLAIYRDEGIVIEHLTPGLELGRHLCEGGNTLYSPESCSAGYARLYAQDHSPYEPKGGLLRDLLDRMNTPG